MKAELAEALAAAFASGQPTAMATLVGLRGSVPQVLGARILVQAQGILSGTIGGGAVEHHIVQMLQQRCIEPSSPTCITVDLTKDLGMCCGGSMVFLMENLVRSERLVIFGAGHVARPTAQFANQAGFRVVVVDDREELNSETRFPNCERILLEPSEAIREVDASQEDYLLALTHDHRLDEEAVRCFASQPHRYFGLIGSKRKVLKIVERLEARGVTLDRERFYAPVGLSVGAETPEEIAIAIVAELIAVRHASPSAHMRLAGSAPR